MTVVQVTTELTILLTHCFNLCDSNSKIVWVWVFSSQQVSVRRAIRDLSCVSPLTSRIKNLFMLRFFSHINHANETSDIWTLCKSTSKHWIVVDKWREYCCEQNGSHEQLDAVWTDERGVMWECYTFQPWRGMIPPSCAEKMCSNQWT